MSQAFSGRGEMGFAGEGLGFEPLSFFGLTRLNYKGYRIRSRHRNFYKNSDEPSVSGTRITIGSFSPASLAFRIASCNSAAYATSRSSSLDRATQASLGTLASNPEMSLAASNGGYLPSAYAYPKIVAEALGPRRLTEIIAFPELRQAFPPFAAYAIGVQKPNHQGPLPLAIPWQGNAGLGGAHRHQSNRLPL